MELVRSSYGDATPWSVPLLGRLFGTAVLVGVIGGWLAVQWGHATAPRTALVATASPEAMQLLRDEHGLVVSIAREKREPVPDSTGQAPAAATRR